MADPRDAKGNDKFIVREGVPIIPYTTKATVSINKPIWDPLQLSAAVCYWK
jgi:hypothetical protein